MDVTNSNADAINTYNELAQELAATNDDVTLGKMFGMPCINVNRKAFAGLFQDDMVFKLTGDAHAQALQLEGARLFDPSNMGRPMKEWVQVPFAHAASWAGMAVHALAYVGKKVADISAPGFQGGDKPPGRSIYLPGRGQASWP